jgi:alkylation response protein AidB-like acyl-CoA dehydrogenase
MNQPGVEVRRIVQPDGGAEFCEVFFTDARCPVANVVGGVNEGWKVAMTTLGFERGTSATTGYRRFEKEWEGVRDLARANGAIDDPVIRQRLAATWSKVQIMRINGLRTLSSVVQRRKDPSIGALGATNKVFWSSYHQEIMELAMDIAGMAGQLLTGDPDVEESVPGYGRRFPSPDYPATVLQSSFFFSRSETIWGGTSQIQKNIVGERVLGLPREPR